MRRLLLSVGLMFTLAGMCGGGGGEEAVPVDQDPVVVPVATDGDDDAEEKGDGQRVRGQERNQTTEHGNAIGDRRPHRDQILEAS